MEKTNVGEEEDKKMMRLTSLLSYCFCIVFLCGVLFTAPACSGPEDPSPESAKKERVKNKKSRKKNKKSNNKKAEASGQETAAEEKPVYVYDATGKVDPFIPLYVETTEKKMPAKVVPDMKPSDEPKTPLQKHALSALKLVAVIQKNKTATALIEDPSGFGYIVEEGTLIGPDNGVIKKIIPNGVVIEEIIYTPQGEQETRISTITIKHKE